jgi:glycine/D-amino acid oxidase-like deaminating enzyme
MDTIRAAGPDFANGAISYWFRDTGLPPRRPALPGPVSADIAIVGAGMTGLWTAYYLAEALPDASIVVLEKDFAGYGASGRNGGWLSGEPAGQHRRYARTHGEHAANALQRHMFNTVDEVLAVAEREEIDADIVKDGLLHVATNAAQEHRLIRHAEQLLQEGWSDHDVHVLPVSKLEERVRVAGARAAYWTPHCARIHPAKFTIGLAHAVERRGVTIYEDTAAQAVSARTVVTNRGTVSATYVVTALEGYTVSLAGQRRKLMPMNSSMIITEPLPTSVWDEIGWRGSELVGDMGHSFAYSHRTADGRIALGGRGVPYNFASSFDPDGTTAVKAIGQLVDKLRAMYPAVGDAAIQHSWSGVLGVPRDWCASVNFDRTTGIASAGGYVGHGLAGTNLAARTLRDLILGVETELSALPWVGRHARRWEVEPIRWIGASTLYAAYRHADRRESVSHSPRTSLAARVADKISGR